MDLRRLMSPAALVLLAALPVSATAASLGSSVSGSRLSLSGYSPDFRRATISVDGPAEHFTRVFLPGDDLVLDLADLPDGNYAFSARVELSGRDKSGSDALQASDGVDRNGRSLDARPATHALSRSLQGSFVVNAGSVILGDPSMLQEPR